MERLNENLNDDDEVMHKKQHCRFGMSTKFVLGDIAGWRSPCRNSTFITTSFSGTALRERYQILQERCIKLSSKSRSECFQRAKPTTRLNDVVNCSR